MARRKTHRRGKAKAGPPPRLAILCSLAALGFIAWLAIRDLGTVAPEKPTPRTLTMAQARAANAAIPFLPGKPAPARPFHFTGGPAAREQAIQCLATAALYEAGGDRPGQKAVMQVVLNRVRRAGYPKTVCGVVYQGASRATGCQFSFTCDGSRTRRPERAGWAVARHAARRALSGYVFRAVGTSTHYHADWIVPYWIGSLDKIARVESHIFYRPRR
ncbi:cell wall hydrolase [uncultured Sphingomonas sp.]|uniref:cell wall hydrolase n=1 Tax=uncultured Sphingomonas sp. TaxID=158754 RepID=UPI002624F2EA|nr:cell wall hydrolase [uncultured Sphingomonas sp.]